MYGKVGGKIIPAIALYRFEREPSGLPFIYNRLGVLCPIRFKMATDLLENFQANSFKANFLNTTSLFM